MTRLMFDSTSPGDVPAGSPLVLGYAWEPRILGASKGWPDDAWSAFAGRICVRMAIYNDRLDCPIIDVEPGNNDAQGAVPFVAGRWAQGKPPTVYCFTDAGPQRYRISDVRAACDAAGVRHPYFLLSSFDGTAEIPDDPEVIGKQYANDAITGGHYDVSVVRDAWPGVDTEDEMTPEQLLALLTTPNGVAAIKAAIVAKGDGYQGYGWDLQAELEQVQNALLGMIGQVNAGEKVDASAIADLQGKIRAIGQATSA